MNWASLRRQQVVFLLLLLAAGLTAQAAYPVLNPQWLAYHRAESTFDKGDFVLAAREYRLALDKGVDVQRAWSRLGEALVAGGRLDEARQLAEEGLARQAGRPEALAMLAGLYDQAGDAERARGLYEDADRRGVLTFVQLTRWGDLLKRVKDYPAAEEVYGRALRERPASAEVMLRLAEMMSWQKRYDDAGAVLGEILSADPGHRQARLHLARLLAWQGRDQEAIEQYRLALGEKP
jgi:tetratricopeptide (TPR) repeat protein